MTELTFLAEWAIRSAALIACGAALLWVLRMVFGVKDASIRLTAWTAMLAASLAIPTLTFIFPGMPITVKTVEVRHVDATTISARLPKEPGPAALPAIAVIPRFDWPRAALFVYALVSAMLLLRLCIGLVMTRRLLRGSCATGRITEGIPILESSGVIAPVTLGIAHPAIVLPGDWREWHEAKLNAVLAHERAHIRRYDPAAQLISAIHRAVLWHSPLSWLLHLAIVRAAEEASDDAAVAATRDPAFYAEVLLEFVERPSPRVSWLGVPMARYGRADKRIHRILDAGAVSRGITRWRVTAIVALVLPLAYIVATVRESRAAPQSPPAASARAAVQPAAAPPPAAIATPATNPTPQPAPQPTEVTKAKRQESPVWLNGLGTVTAATLVVRSKVDGELKSLRFEEGKQVEEGQLLASIAPQNIAGQLDAAREDLKSERARLSMGQTLAALAEQENQVRAAQRSVENLERALASGQVRAPFAGVAGLVKVDPGNFVHTGDPLVVIAQLQPIAVLFSIPEDSLPDVLKRFRNGENVPIEAWNRDNTLKLATGRLAAVDNLIDKTTGTATLKATFDNKDNSLFPNQFVNVRLLLKGQ
jgi:RND family efflux transporter MFP subunit